MAAQTSTQFVTLGLDREVFAVPVTTVREILDLRPLFRVPDAPPYLAGLIDVRGAGVPVIDLRLKLGLPAVAPDESTRILVLEVPVGGRTVGMGLIADRVIEVATFEPDSMGPAPNIGVRWRSDYIDGVARHGGGFVIIFDLERLFSSTETALLEGALATSGDPAAATALN